MSDKNLVSLNYQFLFDASELWPDKYGFEGALADAFEKQGVTAKMVGGDKNVVQLSKGADLVDQATKDLDGKDEATGEDDKPEPRSARTDDELVDTIKIELGLRRAKNE